MKETKLSRSDDTSNGVKVTKLLVIFTTLSAVMLVVAVVYAINASGSGFSRAADSERHLAAGAKKRCFLVVYMAVCWWHTEERQAVRDTWMSVAGPDVCCFFGIGTAEAPVKGTLTLKAENLRHGDILTFPENTDLFVEQPLIILRLNEWVNRNIDFKFIVKTDMDTYVRIQYIKSVLKQIDSPGRLLWGRYVLKNWIPPREKACNKGDPWDEADKNVPYPLGGGYVMSADISRYLAQNWQMFTIYCWEDESVGIWTVGLRILRLHDARFLTYKTMVCDDGAIMIHEVKPASRMREVHNNFVKRGRMCPWTVPTVWQQPLGVVNPRVLITDPSLLQHSRQVVKILSTPLNQTLHR